MLGEALRWGAPREALTELLPAARAALGWLGGPADPDREGLIEYAPTGPLSLTNQGWKDSENAVQSAEGLRRYGFDDVAMHLTGELLDARPPARTSVDHGRGLSLRLGGGLRIGAPDPVVPWSGAGHSQRTPPRGAGWRPSRTGDRVTKRAQCATLIGLGVGSRRSHVDAGPWR
jgi:hypothetical protein